MIKNILILTFGIISLSSISFILYDKYVMPININPTEGREDENISLDIYKEKTEVKEAMNLLSESKFEEAAIKFNSIAESSKDNVEKSMALVDEANIVYEYNKAKAAEKYINIFNNRDLLADIRYSSGLNALQMYKSENNLSYLQPFFPGRVLDPANADDYEYEANRKVYMDYPFGILAARMAIYEIEQNPTKDVAKRVYSEYIPIINTYLEDSKYNSILNEYRPNTILNQARLLFILSKYDVSSQYEVREAFEASYISSKVNDSEDLTKSFINLTYADYLLSQKEFQEADKLIEEFKTFSEGNLIKDYMKNNKYMLLKTDTYIYDYVTKNSKHSAFFKLINW